MIVVALAVLGFYLLASIVGWASIRDAGDRPFNWRIICIPMYYAWLDR